MVQLHQAIGCDWLDRVSDTVQISELHQEMAIVKAINDCANLSASEARRRIGRRGGNDIKRLHRNPYQVRVRQRHWLH